MFEAMVAYIDTSQFVKWMQLNPLLFLGILGFCLVTSYFFFPLVVSIFLYLRNKRLRWKWWILRGKQMSKRARNFELAEALDTLLAEWVTKGKLTRKEKRRYLRNLEMTFELEPGDLTPRPNVHERKRRTLGRLSADTANKFTEKVSAASQPLTKRLSSLISGKV